MDTIDILKVSITDQDDRLLNLRNENLTIRFHIREARLKKIKYVYKMTRYMDVKVNISEGQKEKLQHAIKAGCPAVFV